MRTHNGRRIREEGRPVGVRSSPIRWLFRCCSYVGCPLVVQCVLRSCATGGVGLASAQPSSPRTQLSLVRLLIRVLAGVSVAAASRHCPRDRGGWPESRYRASRDSRTHDSGGSGSPLRLHQWPGREQGSAHQATAPDSCASASVGRVMCRGLFLGVHTCALVTRTLPGAVSDSHRRRHGRGERERGGRGERDEQTNTEAQQEDGRP